jgi:hypothetical protein
MTGINKVRTIVIIAFLLGSIKHGMAQGLMLQEIKFNNNAIYGNVGIGGLYFTATGYYERIITQNSKISSFVKVGFGAEDHWPAGEGGGMYLLAQYGLLTGAKTHHLEIGLGPSYFISGDFKGASPPISGTVGWRIQKPRGNFIFRMGASWPEAVYLGLGFSF